MPTTATTQKTFKVLIDQYANAYNFNEPLGVLAKSGLIFKFGQNLQNDALKAELKKCDNFNQMVNVIGQRTDYLNKPRTMAELKELEETIQRIIKFSNIKPL